MSILPIQENLQSYATHTSQSPTQEVEGQSLWVRMTSDPVALYTGILTVFAAILAISTIGLWWQTRALAKGAEGQSSDMKDSIAETTRASAAMEKLAANSEVSIYTLKTLTSQKMRAYVTVVTGAATYQERTKNLRFAGMPRFVNTGHTLAHKVRFKAKAAILSSSLPEDFAFPLENEVQRGGGAVIGPTQSSYLTIVDDTYFQDEKVAEIKIANRQALHIWGIICYEDVFGEPRETKFCQTFVWFGEDKDETFRGYYNSRHNEAT